MEVVKGIAYKARRLFESSALGEGVLLALTAALISLFGVKTETMTFSPFGTACIAAAWCAGLNPLFAAVGALVGSLASAHFAQAAQCAIYYALALWITRSRGGIARVYRLLLLSAAQLIAYPLFGSLTLAGAASFMGEMCVSSLGAVMTAHAFRALDSLMGKRFIKDDELLALSVLCGVIVLSCGSFELFRVSPGAVLSGLFCLYSVYTKGLASVACAAAIGAGRVLGSGGDMLFIAVMCVSSLLSAGLRAFGKWGTLCGFICSNIVFAALVRGAGTLNYVEIPLVGAAFLLTPRHILAAMDNHSGAKSRDTLQLRLDHMTCRLASLSQVLRELSRLFDNSATDSAEGFINRQLTGISGALKRMIWEDGRKPVRRFDVSIGCASCAKGGSEESGDSHLIREIDGKLLLALSDGMGSGHAARRESAQAVTLLGDLLSVGFYMDEAAECVNRLLMLREGDEIYATLDAAMLDPALGTVSIVKHGANPGYVLRDGRVHTLYNEALPIGIVEQARSCASTLRICSGDMLILISDGVADALGGELIAAIIERAGSAATSEDAASALLEAAMQRGRADDMTVLLAQVA